MRKLHFTELSGRHSVLERPRSEMKRSFIPQSSFKSMARAKAGINAPLTGFQTVDYSNQAEQRIVLLMSIQWSLYSGIWLLSAINLTVKLRNMHINASLYILRRMNCQNLSQNHIFSQIIFFIIPNRKFLLFSPPPSPNTPHYMLPHHTKRADFRRPYFMIHSLSSSWNPYYLLIQEYLFRIHIFIIMVMSKEPLFILYCLPYLFQIGC